MEQSTTPCGNARNITVGMNSSSQPHQRSPSTGDVLPATGFVASRVNSINMTNSGTQMSKHLGSPTPETKRRNSQSWVNSSNQLPSIAEEESDRGRQSRRAFIPSRRTKTPYQRRDTNGNGNDRDTLPSQNNPSSSTTLSRYRPSARMVYGPPTTSYTMMGSIVPPSLPHAMPAAPIPASNMSALDLPHSKGFPDDTLRSEHTSKVVETTETPIPAFKRGHRRKKTTISSMEELVPRRDPHKGIEYGTEAVRAVSAQYTHPSSTPARNTLPIFGACPGVLDCSSSLEDDNKPFLTQSEFDPGRFEPAVLDSKQDADATSSMDNLTTVIGNDTADMFDNSTPQKSISASEQEASLSSSTQEPVHLKPSHERKPSTESNDSGSTVASDSWNTFDPATLSPNATPEKDENHERPSSSLSNDSGSTIASDSYNIVDPETLSPQLTTQPTLRPVHPIRKRASTCIDLFTLSSIEARHLYPLETITYANAETGTDVRDFAFAALSARKKRVRFAPHSEHAPSVHYESDDEEGSVGTLVDLDDDDDDDEALRRGALRVVTVEDNDDDEIVGPSPESWDVDVIETIPTAQEDRHVDIKVRRAPTPTPTPNADNALKNEDDEDDEYLTSPIVGFFPGVVAIPIRSTQKPTPSPLSLFRNISAGLSKRKEKSRTESNIPLPDTPRPLLPTNTGILDRAFEFPARAPEGRAASLPVASSTPVVQRGHKRWGSLGRLLDGFGRKGGEGDVGAEQEKKKKREGLGRRISGRFKDVFLRES
ncbi:hypothetical protein BDW02DRAFT_647477 [Decorospora gaudefroyi]|uniref:Uncharacterized protein n=1 Tax=Decorospora gaudefroyi TaxID=184978 RepID=A0A6A5KG39_9PLEO|nr:hypothetical protein BDW02DRAFT_647477 [Decorospora gaudefroyi]